MRSGAAVVIGLILMTVCVGLYNFVYADWRVSVPRPGNRLYSKKGPYSAVPLAQSVSFAQNQPPSDSARPTPGKTIVVKPPASFGGDQLPTGAEVAFEIPATAGQFLHINVVDLRRVSVRPPHDSAALAAGGDSSGWLYALTETGTYRILFSTQNDPAIEFTFLSASDPAVDPGIKAALVSIDLHSFTHEKQMDVIPYRLNEDEDFQNSWPTHLGIQTDRFEVHIMSVAAYKKIFREYERVSLLQAAVQAKGVGIALKKLPYPVYRDGGLNLSSRPEYLEGVGWRGLRWIGGFGQDTNCHLPLAGQKLGYVFEGINNDGRYFILLRAHLSHQSRRPALTQHCIGEIERDLTAADPGAFSPNASQLDSVVRSLKLPE